MMNLSVDDTIALFAKMADKWYDTIPSAQIAFDEFVAFYCDIRVEGTSLDEDGDELVIEYGPSRPLGILHFRDLRSDENFQEADDEQRYLALTMSRTIYPFSLDSLEQDFDQDSFEVALCMYFERAVGDEEFHSSGACQPNELREALDEYRQNPVILEMLSKMPQQIEAYVGGGG